MALMAPVTSSSLKFETPGTTHVGKLLEVGEPQQQTEYNSQEPSFWDKERTRPKMQVRIKLETAERDGDTDNGVRALYATVQGKQGSLYRAINDALSKAERLGGTLTVTYTGNDPDSKNPANPRKLYTASYQEPSLGQQMTSASQPAAAAAQPPAAQPAAAPQATPQPTAAQPIGQQDAIGKVQQLIGMGFTDEQIANTLGGVFSVPVIANLRANQK